MSAEFTLPAAGSTWVFAGDSITQGVQHTYGARSWVELVSERIRWELDRIEDLVLNSGVSGWRVPDVAGRFEHLVARFAPQVVSLSLGTNDANDGMSGIEMFGHGLTDLVRRSTDLGARVVLHTPVLTTSDAPTNRRTSLPAYADRVRAVAQDTGSVLVDHEHHWHDHFGAKAPTPWMDDHSHPNAVGHRQMANTTLRTLGLGELDTHP